MSVRNLPFYTSLYFKVGLIEKLAHSFKVSEHDLNWLIFFYIVKHSLDLFSFSKIECIYQSSYYLYDHRKNNKY